MKVSELDFKLPPHLLARRPREIDGQKRSDSRLLVIEKDSGKISCDYIMNIKDYLNKGDMIVLNNSKTINAVFRGRSLNGEFMEISLCSAIEGNLWITNASHNISEDLFGEEFKVSEEMKFVVKGHSQKVPELFEVYLHHNGTLIEMSEKYGSPIISNYVEKPWDLKYYQNEHATIPGSVELPAAGRHFTAELIESLKEEGILVEYITLHTGLSSMTIESENFEDHKMYEENYSISEDTATKINETKRNGNRVIAIGTTVTRTLESAANKEGIVQSGNSSTDLYIYPGYKLKVIDGMLTNFHGPRTSRLAMISTIANPEYIKKGYDVAIKNEFLFYEFGDANLII